MRYINPRFIIIIIIIITILLPITLIIQVEQTVSYACVQLIHEMTFDLDTWPGGSP